MKQVSPKQVQDLRKMSGAGMMDCKNALSESSGNLDDAFVWLREKGIAKAEKKSKSGFFAGTAAKTAAKKAADDAAKKKAKSKSGFFAGTSAE